MNDRLDPAELAQLDRIGAASRQHGIHLAAMWAELKRAGVPDDLAGEWVSGWQDHLLGSGCDCEDDTDE